MGKQAWRIFKTHEEYEQGMARLLQLAESDLVEGSPDFEEFELLSLLIGHYEDKNSLWISQIQSRQSSSGWISRV